MVGIFGCFSVFVCLFTARPFSRTVAFSFGPEIYPQKPWWSVCFMLSCRTAERAEHDRVLVHEHIQPRVCWCFLKGLPSVFFLSETLYLVNGISLPVALWRAQSISKWQQQQQYLVLISSNVTEAFHRFGHGTESDGEGQQTIEWCYWDVCCVKC